MSGDKSLNISEIMIYLSVSWQTGRGVRAPPVGLQADRPGGKGSTCRAVGGQVEKMSGVKYLILSKMLIYLSVSWRTGGERELKSGVES